MIGSELQSPAATYESQFLALSGFGTEIAPLLALFESFMREDSAGPRDSHESLIRTIPNRSESVVRDSNRFAVSTANVLSPEEG